MRNNYTTALLAMLAFSFLADPLGAQQSRYPSTGTAWVLPGAWEAPTDRKTRKTLPDADAVKAWEQGQADVSFGGDYGADGNQQIDVINYMYNQTLAFSPSKAEMWYRRSALAAGRDYEDYFLHFTTDTTLAIDDASHSTVTPFARRPDTVGWTADSLHAGFWLYQSPPWDTSVWQHSDQDGALYVLLFEKFDELTLTLSSFAVDGTLVIEYPSAVDGNGMVSQWSPLLFTDGTANLGASGVVKWTPPADWQIASLHDGSGLSYGHGQYFGQSLLRDGGMMYAVRLLWRDGDGNTQPRLDNVQLKDWMPELTPGDSSSRVIPGWNPTNDGDGNGYVDDAEFSARPDIQASARMRWESRVVPLGRMWNSTSDWCRANLFNADFRTEVGLYHAEHWDSQGMKGGYNDDLFKTVGATEFNVLGGGSIDESSNPIDSDELLAEYTTAFVETFASIASATGSPWLTANISAANLFTSADRYPFLDGVSAYLREDYLRSSTGLTGYFGINKAWDIFAMSQLGHRNIVQGTSRSGRARLLANRKKNWSRDQESLLAQYYLLNVPGLTYLNNWNHTYLYGSGNTEDWLYYRAGIPKNVAYQPTRLLEHDLGSPAGYIPAGLEAMKYMVATQAGGDYTVIGDSTDTVLSHPELLPDGSVPTVPSHIFYLDRAEDHPQVADAPTEMVLARTYTNGMVLYRTDIFGSNTDFMATKSQRIILPERRYQRVKLNGKVKRKCAHKIRLRGYEGALLLRNQRCE